MSKTLDYAQVPPPKPFLRRPSTRWGIALLLTAGLTNYRTVHALSPEISEAVPTWDIRNHPNGTIAGVNYRGNILGLSTFEDDLHLMARQQENNGNAAYHIFCSGSDLEKHVTRAVEFWGRIFSNLFD